MPALLEPLLRSPFSSWYRIEILSKLSIYFGLFSCWLLDQSFLLTWTKGYQKSSSVCDYLLHYTLCCKSFVFRLSKISVIKGKPLPVFNLEFSLVFWLKKLREKLRINGFSEQNISNTTDPFKKKDCTLNTYKEIPGWIQQVDFFYFTSNRFSILLSWEHTCSNLLYLQYTSIEQCSSLLEATSIFQYVLRFD